MKWYKSISTCIKCGQTACHHSLYSRCGFLNSEDEGEMIKRTCSHCGYYWYERPLDYIEKEGIADLD
jgi:hypothetical protein